MSHPRPQIDERVLGAGTTVRFALLSVLIFATSTLMALYILLYFSSYDDFGCSLAAGINIDPPDSAANVINKRGLQWEAYDACTRYYASPPSWWVLTVWLILLCAITSGLFWMLPVWKSRRGRVVPLEDIDDDGRLRRLLTDLAATAGLTRLPRVVVDPSSSSTGAVVFGRNRRPTVRLPGGLVAVRRTAPDHFRTVLLHEFAHIRNRDVTITYLTIALWRVFLAVSLLPFVGWSVTRFVTESQSTVWVSEVPILTRGLLLTVVMVLLVYLARSDVLRSREIYADLAASRWGAAPLGSAVTKPDTSSGTVRRVLGSFAELWSIHPRWDLRCETLTDPAVLFGVRALPMFLTGATAAVINTNVWYLLAQYVLLSGWMEQAAAIATASLVAGVIGIALWRAVVYAVLTSRRVPSGVRAGLWLGAGMVAGGVVTGQGTSNQWLPAEPEVFVLVVLTATAFTWWIAQCALLWGGVWKGRKIRPVMLLCLGIACLALSWWFFWWQTQGVALAAGWAHIGLSTSDINRARDLMASSFYGRDLGHSGSLPVIDAVYAVVLVVLRQMFVAPLGPVAIAGLWIVPLLAWAIRAPNGNHPVIVGDFSGPHRWARAAIPYVGADAMLRATALPPLRRVLVPGLLGGVLCWAAQVGVQAHMHALLRSTISPVDFAMIFLAWILAVLVIAAAVAAVVASALVSRYRLLAALIAAETATLVGFVGVFGLWSFDGCLQSLTVYEQSCMWRPGTIKGLYNFFLGPALSIALLLGIAAAAIVAMLSRIRASTGSVTSQENRTSGVFARRVGVGILCTVTVGTAIITVVELSPQSSRLPTPVDVQRQMQQYVPAVADPPPSAQSKALMVQAWRDFGGGKLMDRFYDDRRRLFVAVKELVDAGKNVADLREVRPLCVDIADLAQATVHYFRVPDQRVQQTWTTFVTQAWQHSQDCEKGLDQQDVDRFNASMHGLAAAQDVSNSVDNQIDALMRAGGLKP
ncbi:M56 family metallopeptidase [Actinocrispum wychmicini]|uniref:Zn-dependent protease with chaperone function n=1 Tax=Actinocrispum wychmicini TaxID=1213861 RepID=A0A4R2JH06_9PSEU|nr:M56 family metallopeptidase [Actinocrispum wychmicini]TCO55659.1 Zn-dependent protease with chaperone function [Actinocrispum wychmicini]